MALQNVKQYLDLYLELLEEHNSCSEKLVPYDNILTVRKAEYAEEIKRRRPDPRVLITLQQEIKALDRLSEHWLEELERISDELDELKCAAGLSDEQQQCIEQEFQLCLMMEETKL